MPHNKIRFGSYGYAAKQLLYLGYDQYGQKGASHKLPKVIIDKIRAAFPN